MSKTMISIRIPSSLVTELKDISRKDHFMDLSESVRSIIRNNWLKHKEPLAYQMKHLRKEISDNIAKKSQADIIEELRKIRDQLTK